MTDERRRFARLPAIAALMRLATQLIDDVRAHRRSRLGRIRDRPLRDAADVRGRWPADAATMGRTRTRYS